jgi:hypothetical protein
MSTLDRCRPTNASAALTLLEGAAITGEARVLVNGVVPVDDRGGYPASVGHLNALLARPFTNRGEILARPRCPRTPRASRTCASTADLGSRIEVRLEGLRHCSSILLRQVDRVVDTIERKRKLGCVLRTVEIVGDVSNRCLRHGPIVADGVRGCLFDGFPSQARRPTKTLLRHRAVLVPSVRRPVGRE